MPEASDELRKKFELGQQLPNGGLEDGINKAEQIIIQAGGTVNVPTIGMIKLPEELNSKSWRMLDYDLKDAICFLCDEWDYALSGESV